MNLSITKTKFTKAQDVVIPEIFNRRLQTGIARIDDNLGSGFLPGSVGCLTGSAGSGKTTMLLQIMEEGRLTDSFGRQIDFRNVILIMTSNAGAADMQKAAIGFGRDKREGEDTAAIERTFTPEFRNRLDAVISFAPLSREVVVHVVEKFVLQLEAQLMDRNVHIELTPEAADWLAEKGYDDQMGARPLGRVIQENIKKPLAEELLFGRLMKGGVVRVKIEDDKPAFDITGPDAPRIGKSRTPLLTAD